ALQRNQVENARTEVTDLAASLMGHIAGHRQRLEVDLRPHHRRAKVQQNTAFQPGDCLGEDQEVLIARLSQRGTVAVGMFVQDVIADADVYRHRHSKPNSRGQYTQVLVRKSTFEDLSS